MHHILEIAMHTSTEGGQLKPMYGDLFLEKQ